MRQEIRNCKSDQKNATSENVTSLELVSFFQRAIKLIVSPGVLNDVEWMIGVLRVSMTSVTTPGMGIGVIVVVISIVVISIVATVRSISLNRKRHRRHCNTTSDS